MQHLDDGEAQGEEGLKGGSGQRISDNPHDAGKQPKPRKRRTAKKSKLAIYARAGPAQDDRWRQIFRLGEQLLEVGQDASAGAPSTRARLLAQRDLIVGYAARLLAGEADLWLADVLAPNLAAEPRRKEEGDLFTSEPTSSLMCHAFLEHMICFALRDALPAEGEGGTPKNAFAIAAPLKTHDAQDAHLGVFGVIQVTRREGPPFSQEDISLVEGLALQSAIALQADRRMALERWRVEQLSLVRQVSAQIVGVRDLDELARRVTQLISETFNYYYVAIFTLEPEQEILHFRASAKASRVSSKRLNANPVEVFSPALVVHLGEGLIGIVAQTGEEVLASEVKSEARFHFLESLPETRSEVTLPLKIDDRILGVLDVQSDRASDFGETDLLVLRALAHFIAVAVEGAGLYYALRRRAEQLSTISEVSSAITSILDLDELLNQVVELIYKRFGFPFVHLFTVHTGRRKIIYEAGSGAHSQFFRDQGYALDLDDPEGLIPWVARHGETVLANDVANEPRYRPSPLPPDNTLSELTIPLIFGGEVLGVLDLQSDHPNTFSEDDRFLFEALADSVAIAMRNASLYHSEQWRRQVAERMREVAVLLSADLDLDQVLDAILSKLESSLPCDIAAIWLLDEESSTARPEALRLAAVHCSRTAGFSLELGLSLAQILGSKDTQQSQERFSLPPETAHSSDWLTEVLGSDVPVIRRSGAEFEPIGSALGFLADYSAIAAPLRVGEQHLGVLTLAHQTPGRYGSEANGMTAAFASYAAAAIENTRLYEAAHEQAWISTVLLQVADAIQSVTNINELLATVVRITPTLIGVKACGLYMLDDGEVFVPAASAGLSREQQAEFERWRFAPGDVPALDRLRLLKEPILLHGENEDSRLSVVLFPGLKVDTFFETEFLAFVPLLTRGEVLGAFLIDFSKDQSSGRSLQGLEAQLDERLVIIQGIAHQTAIAVENIRLLKAQKEEAYVSVALLQVAQAVVSSNDLDEVLASIVRITPILVGVKRALVYLWDAQRTVFQPAETYGIPRNVDMRPFAAGEFLLLDAVRERDSLVVFPLDRVELLPPGPPDAWAQFIPPEPEKVNEHLETAASLLMAFPLSVKGDVLGVMLVEEPESARVDGFANTGSVKRLREKRLEITTGISQQVALAIQNDRLQRDMVKRERLEREMQLARDIQRDFLPRQLPILSGWDLSARWRPAREVGGDFYDVFELEDGRLGLVIADVADKGMPAALFMILIRTLVRATVQELKSPAEVLERVNNVLVPDALQGMFVTIVYAVLNLATGELTYANAGHNPSLWFKSRSGQLERFLKSGMAIGVLEGIHIEERTISLEPGDYLIFYTDGVTEAFAPTGEMYGEDALQSMILSTGSSLPSASESAEDMVEAIDDAVSEFIEDTFPSDDLTLMVLKRLGENHTLDH